MADIRINSLPSTASASSSDDFLALDGATNGTRKLNAFSPTFGGNLTVSGTGTNSFSGPIAISASGTDAAGFRAITTSSAQTGYVRVGADTASAVCDIGVGGSAHSLTAIRDKLYTYSNGAVRSTMDTSGNLVLTTGNLTVSGTGTSSFAGSVSIAKVLPTDFGALSVYNDLGSSASALQAGVSGSGRGGTYFGQSEANSSIIFSNGTSSNGLLIGSFNAKQVVIGTNNTAAISINGTTQATTLYGNLTVSGTGASTVNGNLLITGTTNYTRIRRDDTIIDFTNAAQSAYANAQIIANNLHLKGNNGTGIYVNSSGNGLFGTTTDSGNGRIQLATHTTSAGGIGFGTDTALYRVFAGELVLSHVGGTNPYLYLNENGTNTAQFSTNGGNAELGTTVAGKSLTLKTAANTTALTLDSSQNATFAGAVSISKANPELAIRSASDAAGQIQYLTFGSPTYNRSQFRVTSAGTSDGSIALYTFNAGSAVLSQTWDKDGNATFAGAITSSRPYQDISSGLSNIYVYSTDTAAQDKGGTIQLGGAYTGTTTTTFGGVRGSKESTTAGETGGQLEFFTRANGGAMTRRAYISSTGNATFAGSIAINNTVQTAAAVASTHKVTISIGGTTYYLLATNV